MKVKRKFEGERSGKTEGKVLNLSLSPPLILYPSTSLSLCAFPFLDTGELPLRRRGFLRCIHKRELEHLG